MIDPDTRRAARIATLVAVPATVLAGALIWWLLSGGTGGAPQPSPSTARPTVTTAVSMPATSLAPRAATVCRALLATLPDAIRDLPARPVTAGPEQNAAYGEPPLRLACGADPVALPANSTATVYPLSGVCWYAEPAGGGTRWTTLDREVPVSVTVPESRAEPGQWVAAFSRYVSRTPRGGSPPSGCGR